MKQQELKNLNNTKPTRAVIWLSFLAVSSLLFWTYEAKIDQLIRGEGRVVPAQKTQSIENLEGGIVAKVLVHEGQKVAKDEVLMELDQTVAKSKKQESAVKIKALKAKLERLNAEAKGVAFKKGKAQPYKEEYALYQANQKLLKQEIKMLKKELFQKQNELSEKLAKKRNLKESVRLTQKEVTMKRELLAKLVGSRNELNLAEQKLSSIKGEFEATSLAIPRLRSVIEGVKSKIKKVQIDFRQKALEQKAKVALELAQLQESNVAKEDKLKRTTIRSPLNGVVQQIFHHTIGGVIKAGEPIMQIVPTDDALIVTAKIRPSDIAFIYLGQKAMVRFSAYDFAIYGSLKGEVINISADTILDEVTKRSYYQVQIRTDKNYLGSQEQKLKIMTGMVATVDIVGQKQRVLEYVLKPILRGKQGVLSGR